MFFPGKHDQLTLGNWAPIKDNYGVSVYQLIKKQDKTSVSLSTTGRLSIVLLRHPFKTRKTLPVKNMDKDTGSQGKYSF